MPALVVNMLDDEPHSHDRSPWSILNDQQAHRRQDSQKARLQKDVGGSSDHLILIKASSASAFHEISAENVKANIQCWVFRMKMLRGRADHEESCVQVYQEYQEAKARRQEFEFCRFMGLNMSTMRMISGIRDQLLEDLQVPATHSFLMMRTYHS